MKYLIGNWKMYLAPRESEKLAHGLTRAVRTLEKNFKIALCPSFDALDRVRGIIKKSVFDLGAQNVSAHAAGAYTGEVGIDALREFGCHFVILGHSERRKLGETDAEIARKAQAVLEAGLTPILCVGETALDRDANKRASVLREQLKHALSLATITCLSDHKKCKRLLVAYEPVWAISGNQGTPDNPENARDAHKFIRNTLDTYFPDLSKHIHIIYGGSVNAKNVSSFLQYDEIEGALIGVASTKLPEFLKIIKTIQ